MPYSKKSDLPDHLSGLPLGEANKWSEIFHALKKDGEADDKAAKIAWATIRKMGMAAPTEMIKAIEAGITAQLGALHKGRGMAQPGRVGIKGEYDDGLKKAGEWGLGPKDYEELESGDGSQVYLTSPEVARRLFEEHRHDLFIVLPDGTGKVFVHNQTMPESLAKAEAFSMTAPGAGPAGGDEGGSDDGDGGGGHQALVEEDLEGDGTVALNKSRWARLLAFPMRLLKAQRQRLFGHPRAARMSEKPRGRVKNTRAMAKATPRLKPVPAQAAAPPPRARLGPVKDRHEKEHPAPRPAHKIPVKTSKPARATPPRSRAAPMEATDPLAKPSTPRIKRPVSAWSRAGAEARRWLDAAPEAAPSSADGAAVRLTGGHDDDRGESYGGVTLITPTGLMLHVIDPDAKLESPSNRILAQALLHEWKRGDLPLESDSSTESPDYSSFAADWREMVKIWKKSPERKATPTKTASIARVRAAAHWQVMKSRHGEPALREAYQTAKDNDTTGDDLHYGELPWTGPRDETAAAVAELLDARKIATV